MAKSIVIMAGGTGGHVYPALAVALHLKSEGWQVSWIGTQKGLESRVVPEHSIDIDWLSVQGLRGKGLVQTVTNIFKLFASLFQSYRILHKRRPDVVLGMGGYVAGPGGLLASWLKIPLLIQEQNRVPGTTNRWLSKKATQVLEAFPDSFDASVHAVCTGNPLRQGFLKNSEKTFWQQGSGRNLRVLVLGGSLGARALNNVLPDVVKTVSDVDFKHQTGSLDFENVKQVYEQYVLETEVLAFIEDMNAAYQWADLVICRAGAMTVSELAAAGLPAIFIPLPHAIDDHQTANAHYLVDAGAGILLNQADLTVGSLLQAIDAIKVNLNEMSVKAKSMAKINATEHVAKICHEVAKV